MVCLGNICRSPMADGLLRRKISERKLDLIVDSAGTANYHVGSAPDKRMIETGKRNGTPIDFLRARQFTKADFKNFDYILVMDQSNFRNVSALASSNEDQQKVHYLLDELYPNQQAEVPDPYYGSLDDFQSVYELLDQATDAFLLNLFK
ncbi:MAG: hypothetical protein RLZZ301_1748 [Bacteroidota bacterium]|jgi:protein-tyrosine phosphatase